MVKYGETNMVERGPPRFKLRRSFLFGVINVLVYEAPKELVVNNVLKTKIYILCLYNH
jgi:hypothetical protein